MAKKVRKKTTPEQWAKWSENQRRLEEIIQRRLAQEAADPEVQARKAQQAQA